MTSNLLYSSIITSSSGFLCADFPSNLHTESLETRLHLLYTCTYHNKLSRYGYRPLYLLLQPLPHAYGVVGNGHLEGAEVPVVDETHDDKEEDGDHGDDDSCPIDGGDVGEGLYPGLQRGAGRKGGNFGES